MAYATVVHVNDRINGFAAFTVDANSSPDDTTVGRFLDEASAMVDSALSQAGYGTIPATGANDTIMLRKIVADYVAYQTYATAFGHDNIPDTFVAIYGDSMRFIDLLKKIADTDLQLIDQSDPEPKFITGFVTRVDGYSNDITSGDV